MRATEFVESYFDAWNHRDPKGVADHLAADGIYCDIPENARRSHDELITSLSFNTRCVRSRKSKKMSLRTPITARNL
jgi:hypothetical protein